MRQYWDFIWSLDSGLSVQCQGFLLCPDAWCRDCSWSRPVVTSIRCILLMSSETHHRHPAPVPVPVVPLLARIGRHDMVTDADDGWCLRCDPVLHWLHCLTPAAASPSLSSDGGSVCSSVHCQPPALTERQTHTTINQAHTATLHKYLSCAEWSDALLPCYILSWQAFKIWSHLGIKPWTPPQHSPGTFGLWACVCQWLVGWWKAHVNLTWALP